jgi:hypothetical protein
MSEGNDIRLIEGDKVTDANGREWLITVTDDEQITIAVGLNDETGKLDVVEAVLIPAPVTVARMFTHIEGA